MYVYFHYQCRHKLAKAPATVGHFCYLRIPRHCDAYLGWEGLLPGRDQDAGSIQLGLSRAVQIDSTLATCAALSGIHPLQRTRDGHVYVCANRNNVRVFVCLYIYIHIHINFCGYAHPCKPSCMHACMHAHPCIHTGIHTYMKTYMHTCIDR